MSSNLVDDTMISIKRGVQPATGGSPSITDLGTKIYQGSRNNQTHTYAETTSS